MRAVDLGLGTRLRFALRVAVAFLIGVVLLGGYYFLRYDLDYYELPRTGFWTLLGTVFISLCAMVSADWLAHRARRISVFLAACLGLLAGIVWAFSAFFPIGLFPGWLVIPVVVVWPLSAAVAFAYADAAQARREQPGRAALSFALALLALCWIPAIKLGLAAYARPQTAFASSRPPRVYQDPRGLSIHAAPRGNCIDPAPRLAALPDSLPLTHLGDFANLGFVEVNGRVRLTGYLVRLFAAGEQVTGTLHTWLGSGHSYVGLVEGDIAGEAIRFRAFYRDEYFDALKGSLKGRRLQGTLTTADVVCVRRVISTTRLTLERQEPGSGYPFGLTAVRTVAQLFRAYPQLPRRPSQP